MGKLSIPALKKYKSTMSPMTRTEKIKKRSSKQQEIDNISNKANAAARAHRRSIRDSEKSRYRRDFLDERKKEIARLAQLRREQLRADDQLKLTREQLYANVSHIIVNHISEAQRLIPVPTEGSKLFHEYNFMRHQWTIETMHGYSSTMPFFHFYFEKVPYEEVHPAVEDVMRFIRNVMDQMQLTTECIVIGLIYLEKVMLTGKIEIRDFNWKPLVFTATLLASKFWEDIIWYNVDFVEAL